MKKRIRLIVTVISIALIAGLLLWRFLPRSSSYLISVDQHAFTGFSAIATVSYIEDGVPYSNIYRIENTPQYTEVLEEVLEILATSRYRPDFRNLLPGGLRQIDGGKKYDGRIISLAFSAETQEGFVHIQFLSSRVIPVSAGSRSGLLAYHPTNRETMDKLVEYLQANGVKQ